MRTTVSNMLLLVIVSAACASHAMVLSTSELILRGKSSGGVLTLTRLQNYPPIMVTNQPGDPPKVVIDRLVRELSADLVKEYYGGNSPVVEIKENSLVLLVGGIAWMDGRLVNFPKWVLGGTDTGFEIPRAPVFLTATYVSNEVVLKWENQDNYDHILIHLEGAPVFVCPGKTNEFVFKGQGMGPDFFSLAHYSKDWIAKMGFTHPRNLWFTVVGLKDGVPSNGTGVRLLDGRKLECSMNLPFTQGLAPGFKTWGMGPEVEWCQISQGNLWGVDPDADWTLLEGKGFYQILKGPGVRPSGVFRRFLGLKPGHAYRVSARLIFLKATDGNWAFTFHAAPDGGKELSAAQMAGVEALPNGLASKTAGQICRYQQEVKVVGQWIKRSSGDSAPDNVSGDIVLPPGCDSITVWFRLEGKDSTGVAIGFDSLTIEDLGAR